MRDSEAEDLLQFAEAEIVKLAEKFCAARATMLWVADKLAKLEKLPPHEWNRSTLRALRHALLDSPRIPKE